MFRTKVCEILGIEYPIIQGGMQWLSRAELVAAVSDAGGLGILVSAMFQDKEKFREEIKKVKELTDKPFAVNINLFPTLRPVRNEDYIEVMVEEGVKIAETSGRSPEPLMKMFKEGGIKVIHKVARVRDARTAERVGVDMVSIVGYEAGGHPGMENLTTMIQIPLAKKAVNIPVIAGGGIVDGKGFVAALSLGADGVVVGTRFMLTKECPLHPKTREWLLSAQAQDTKMILYSIKNAMRAIRNKALEKVEELEGRGATLEELAPVISGERGRVALLEGDVDAGIVSCGEAIGLIDDVPTCKEVIDRIISEAKEIILNSLYPLVSR